MVAFDVYRSVGPQIDVNLFGDAAKTGAALGQAIPSAFTSIGEGAKEGYKYVQDRQLEAAQIENAEAVAKINSTKASIDAQTEGAELKAAEAKLENEAGQATEENAIRKAQNEFLTRYQEADSETQKQMVLSGEAFPLLAKSPAFAKQVYQQTTLNPTLTGVQKAQLNTLLGHATIDDHYLRQAQANEPKFIEAREQYLNGEGGQLTSKISDVLQVPRENAADSVRFVDSTDVKIDPDTNRIMIDDVTGKDLVPTKEERILNESVGKTRLAISTRPDTKGIVVDKNVNSKTESSYYDYKAQRGLQTGLQAEYAKRYNQPVQRPSSSQAVTGVPVFNTRGQSLEPTAPVDPFKAKLKKDLGLSEVQLKAADAPLTQLKEQLKLYSQQSVNRNDPLSQILINNTTQTAARAMSDAQYDSDPAIQTQYTQSHIKRYNEVLEQAPLEGLDVLPPSMQATYRALLQAYKLQDPKDLYYQQQGTVIAKQLSDISFLALEAIRVNKARLATKADIIKNRNSSISKWASGSGEQ